MSIYVIYDVNGIIREFQTITPDGPSVVPAGYFSYPASASDVLMNNQRIFFDVITNKVALPSFASPSIDKTNILSDGVDKATISGLPDPCCISVNDVVSVVSGGTYSVSTSAQGTLSISLVGRYYMAPLKVTAYVLADLKTYIAGRIDAAAETCRLKYITGGSGKALSYLQKVDEAKACQLASSPVDTDYPFLNAEAIATGVTVAAMAATVLSLRSQWIVIGSNIEGICAGAKKAANAAQTIDAAFAAEQVTWP